MSRARASGWSVPRCLGRARSSGAQLMGEEWVEIEFPDNPFAPLEEEGE